jgi:hypothetical protein
VSRVYHNCQASYIKPYRVGGVLQFKLRRNIRYPISHPGEGGIKSFGDYVGGEVGAKAGDLPKQLFYTTG